jgi:hypothetical protein
MSGGLARLAGLPHLQEGVPTAAEVTISGRGPGDQTAFVLGDSFYRNRLEKFFAPHFHAVEFEHHAAMHFPLESIRRFSPDIVLLIVAERLLTKTLDAPPPDMVSGSGGIE